MQNFTLGQSLTCSMPMVIDGIATVDWHGWRVISTKLTLICQKYFYTIGNILNRFVAMIPFLF